MNESPEVDFQPEKVERNTVHRSILPFSPPWSKAEPYIEVVLASDYDKLLEMYRTLQKTHSECG